MHKAFFSFLAIFILIFPSFLKSSLENEAKEISYKNKTEFNKTLMNHTFSLQPTILERKIFEKPKEFFLQAKIEKAFLRLKNFKEEKIRKMVFPRKSFFQKINLKKSSLSEEKKKELNKVYTKLIFLKNFALGFFSYKNNKWDRSIYYFQKSLRQSSQNFKINESLIPYIHFFLGQSYIKKRLYAEAEEELKKTQNYKLPSNLRSRLLFELSSIYIENKKWSLAKKSLKSLERKWRFKSKHPEVLWRLMHVAYQQKKAKRVCYWAKKIYSRYPTHPLIHNWTLNLKEALYKDQPLNCEARYREQIKRVQNLQFAGESTRAEKEIEKMRKQILEEKGKRERTLSFLKQSSSSKKRAKDGKIYGRKGEKRKKEIKEEVEKEIDQDLYNMDKIYALFLIYEGYPNQALNLLLAYSGKEDFDYVRLLGKAAEPSGKYKIAANSYYESYKRNPYASKRRKALFFSAFLSYRFQDYENALKKINEFVVRYKRSRLTPHAYWYMGWIKYLQRKFKDSASSFEKILKIKNRKKGSWKNISEEKLKYWLAMSYMKGGEFHLSKEIFEDLMSNKLLSYYAILSLYRYNNLRGVKPIKSLIAYHQQSIENREKKLNHLSLSSFGESKTKDHTKKENDKDEERREKKKDKGESDFISDLEEKRKEEFEEEKFFYISNSVERENRGSLLQGGKKDSIFRKNFERAKDLSLIGAYYWARWELYEVEIKTKKLRDFKLLIEAYKEIQSFHRSSYISTVYLGEQRESRGLLGERDLWEEAFPRAYHQLVHLESNNFGISKELIWSIMRAESKYRSDITSPVGAEGLMQIMPTTAKKVAEKLLKQAYLYSYENLKKPKANIKIGTRYLKRLLNKFEDQIPLAAASYNAGPHRVRHWLSSFGFLDMDEFIEHIPFLETRRYVKKVMRNYKIYQYLYKEKIKSMNWLIKPIAMNGKEDIRPTPKEIWDPLPY